MRKNEADIHVQTPPKKLMSIPSVFRSIIQVFHVRKYVVWFVVSGVIFTLVSRLFVVIPPLLFIAMQSAEQTTIYIILIIVSLLVFCYITVFSFSLFLLVSRRILRGQDISLKTSMIEAYHTVGKTALTIFLFGLFVLLGCIVLVIPGLLLAIFFFFAPTISVLAKNNKHPFKQSRALFKGRFWAVLLRLLIVYVFVVVPPYLLSKWNTDVGQLWGITTSFSSLLFTKIYLDIEEATS